MLQRPQRFKDFLIGVRYRFPMGMRRTQPNRNAGAAGENAVCDLYQKHGFKILVRNFDVFRSKKLGEIDLIAEKANHLHFVEVKTRGSQHYGSAIEAMSFAKRNRIIFIAKYFLTLFENFSGHQPHFDVATVQLRVFDKSIESIRIYSDVIEETG